MTARILLVVLVAACHRDVAPTTTDGAIAVANLDALLERQVDVELLLARARFLADHDALHRAVALAEQSGDLRIRARAHGAAHRFGDALDELAALEQTGVDVTVERATLYVAVGRTAEALPLLERAVERAPGYPTHGALAGALAASGAYDAADREYDEAAAALDTTSPFPYAWLELARGTMWAEQAGDPARGEAAYLRALHYLPQFATANLHLAELEATRGDRAAALARVDRVLAIADDPEAHALAARLAIASGDVERGRRELARAGRRFDDLLATELLAFADHAARYFLADGADPERAWQLARQNLANRPTRTAYALAMTAALANLGLLP